jgi:hypothetical protein
MVTVTNIIHDLVSIEQNI